MSTAYKTPERDEKATIKKKGQVTLPVSIRKTLDLREEDQLAISIEDGRIIMEPMVSIPKDQAWFFTPEWQQGEEEAQKEIDNGELVSFHNVDDAIAWLDSEE